MNTKDEKHITYSEEAYSPLEAMKSGRDGHAHQTLHAPHYMAHLPLVIKLRPFK